MSGESIGLNFVAVAGLIAGAGRCLIPPVGLKGPGSWQAPGLHTQLWVVVVFVDGLAVVSVHSLGTSGWLVLRVNLGSLRLLGQFYREMDPCIFSSFSVSLGLSFHLGHGPFLSLSISLAIYIYLSAYLVSSRIFLLLVYLKCISSKVYYGALY